MPACLYSLLRRMFGAGPRYYLDPAFVSGMGPMREEIAGVEVLRKQLSELRCVLATDDGGWRPARIEETPAYGFLQGDEARYAAYVRQSGHATHGVEAFRALEQSLLRHGYPHQGRYMVLFGDEPYLRDGQHRAALLRRHWGEAKVPVLRIRFRKGYKYWRALGPAADGAGA